MIHRIRRAMSSVLVMLSVAASGVAEPRPIDAQKSKLIVRAYKSGLFSAFAHDHEIAAPVAAGRLDETAPSVELRVEARALRVLDPKLPEDKRAEVDRTMKGPEVLDAARYPEIRFRSTSVEKMAPEAWRVKGTVEIHGQARPVEFEVKRAGGVYRGFATLRQTEFGITPVKAAGGAVKVKDEIRVEFEITAGS